MSFVSRVRANSTGNIWDRLRLPEGWLKQLILVSVGLAVGAVGGISVWLLPNPLLGFAAIAGVVVGFFMLTHPVFTLSCSVAICCLLPFGVIPVHVGLTFTFLEATMLVLLVGWLLRLSIGNSRYSNERFLVGPFDGTILLLLGLSIFSLLLNWQTSNSSDVLHNYFKWMLAVISFWPILNLIRTQAVLDRLLRTIMLCGGLAAFIGLGLYVLNQNLQRQLLLLLGYVGYPTDDRVLRYHDDDPTQAQRITGTSVDPNSYAGMLVLIMALLLTQLLSPKPLLRRWQLFVMLLGTVIALGLTYGRGAQLGAIALAIFISLKYRRLWAYALPFVAIGAAIIPNTFIWTRLMAGFALQDASSQLHVAEFQNAFNIIGRYPWFGIGYGAAPDPDLQAGVSSIYFTVGERMGLNGLAAFIILIIAYMLHVATHFWKIRDEKQKANLLGLFMGVLGALIVGILDHYFFNIEFSHMAALLWLFIALTVTQIRLSRETNEAAVATPTTKELQG